MSRAKRPEWFKGARRLKRRRCRWPFAAAAALTFLMAVVWSLNREWFLLRTVAVTGAGAGDEVITLANRELSGRYFGLLPRRNFLLYPRRQIAAVLLKTFPQFQTVVLAPTGRRDLLIEVKERQPAFLWCEPGTEHCAFVDASGFAFAEALQLSGHSFFVLETAVAVAVPGRPFDEMTVGRLLTVRDGVLKLLPPSLMPEPVAYRVSFVNGEGRLLIGRRDSVEEAAWPFLFNLSDDPATILSNAVAAFRQPDFLRELQAWPSQVEYIDLRFNGKVFYRFKD